MTTDGKRGLLCLEGAEIWSREGKSLYPAVKELSFSLEKGSCLGIIGESGCGKTLLCRSILGLLAPDQWKVDGSFYLEGKTLPPRRRGAWLGSARQSAEIDGRSVGFIAQGPAAAFDPRMTLGAHFLEMAGPLSLDRPALWDRALLLLKKMGFDAPERILKSYPFQMSGGMLQRAAIALALLGRPRLLIADEPTTALDVTTQAEILHILYSLKEGQGLAILMISHDLKVIKAIADTICVMYAGYVVEQGPAEAVLTDPRHPYTKGLLAARPTFSKKQIPVMEGCPPRLKGRPSGCPFAPRCQEAGRLCQTDCPPLKEAGSPSHLVRCFHVEGRLKGQAGSLHPQGEPPARKGRPPSVRDEGRRDGTGTILAADHIGRRYRLPGKGYVEAVRDLSLSLQEGERRGIVGESGCGKSTLIRMLAGLDVPDGGQILYQGRPLRQEMKKCRNEIQLIFQDSFSAVNPYATAEEILQEPLSNFTSLSRRERQEQAALLMERVGLSPKELSRYPGQFSGGQLQRLCIARALAAEPKVLLMDEPLSSLDVSVQAQILSLFDSLGEKKRLTQVMVSHDLEAIYHFSDSISVLYRGCVVEEILDIACFGHLCHPYTRRLLEACSGVVRDSSAAPLDPQAQGKAPFGCPYAPNCKKSSPICQEAAPPLFETAKGHWVRCHKAFDL